ncbi:hypothetical protein L9F63_020668 [Diploptera punctata]|uniref:Gustatory receptor n=1 Tax=Diploptera punctata TaxID=6984 RepID=A0AAD7ZR15_DIPPU|nr:hypothetical protein L9F63_020668 [Diploptera punctata]
MSSNLNSFYQSMQPLFELLKTFGLFPFKLSHNARMTICMRNKLFLPTIWFFVALAAGICSLIGFFGDGLEDKILRAVYTANLCFLDLTALSMNDILKKLLAFDQLLDNSTTLVLYKQSRSSFIKTVSFVTLFVTIYVTIVQGIRLRHYQLWHILKTLPKEKKEQVCSQMVGGCIYNSYIADTFRISILREQHFHLSNVVSLLNEVYGFTILLEIMTALSGFVGSVYEGIQLLNRDENPMEILTITLSGALLFIPVIWMAMSCHQVVQQNKEHIRAIQKLLISKSITQRTENELKELLLQINLMKPKFSAGGFFNLNLKFL